MDREEGAYASGCLLSGDLVRLVVFVLVAGQRVFVFQFLTAAGGRRIHEGKCIEKTNNFHSGGACGSGSGGMVF